MVHWYFHSIHYMEGIPKTLDRTRKEDVKISSSSSLSESAAEKL